MRHLFESRFDLAALASAIAAFCVAKSAPASAQLRDAAAATATRAGEATAANPGLLEGFAYMGVTAALVGLALMLLSPRLWDKEPPR